MSDPLDIVVFGPSRPCACGSGRAAVPALVRGLAEIGHRVELLEGPVDAGRAARVRHADAVLVASGAAEGVAAAVTDEATGVTAFYDLDAPRTLAELARGVDDPRTAERIAPELVPRFDLYLSLVGGPFLDRLELEHGARRALPLYPTVDANRYVPVRQPRTTALGYLGAWAEDREPKVQTLLLDVARREPDRFFAIAGAGWADAERWPRNVLWRPHVPPDAHPVFYGQQGFTLNLTRADRATGGWSPSVRLFEAAACATAILTDPFEGLETFFRPGREVLVVESTEDVLRVLRDTPEAERVAIGAAARRRVFAEHTAVHRALELTEYLVAAGRWGPLSIDRPTVSDRL